MKTAAQIRREASDAQILAAMFPGMSKNTRDANAAPAHASAPPAAPACRCSLRTQLVGDGCSVCNPELAADMAAVDCECGVPGCRYHDDWRKLVAGEEKPKNSYDNQTHRAGKTAKLERNLRNGPLAKSEAEKGNPERVLVRVTSVRKRLIDEDNLAEKYHVDCCRYAGLIHGDEPSKTKIEVCQRKAEKDEAEHTIIEITTP